MVALDPIGIRSRFALFRGEPSLRFSSCTIRLLIFTQAVLSNEFRSLNLTCSPSDIVPSGPSYADPRYQTCLLPGSTPGSLTVSGSRYLATAYDFHHHPGRNLAILLLQALVFLLLSVIATELFHFAPEGQKRLWARTERVKKRLTAKWYKIPGGEGLMGASTLTDADAEVSAFGEEAEPIPGIEGRTLTVGLIFLRFANILAHVFTRTVARRLALDRHSARNSPPPPPDLGFHQPWGAYSVNRENWCREVYL